MASYLEPQGGGSLMLAFRSQANSVLIIGSSTVAATRAFAARDADYDILLLAPGNLDNACPEIRYRVSNGQAEILNWDNIFTGSEDIADAVGKLLGDKAQISLVCVCDTSLREGRNRRSFGSAKQIYDACRSHRVPINVADIPELCSFTFPASHRFSNPESGSMTPLQISVTTNGKGCRLGGRFKREIVSKLPKLAGVAVEKIGRLRELSQSVGSSTSCDTVADTVFLEAAISLSPNVPILPLPQTASDVEKSQQRMRWVAQISEFWQIERLAGLNQPDMESLLQENRAVLNANTEKVEMMDPTLNHQPSHLGESYMHAEQSRHGLTLTAPSGDRGGKIYLLGSGIGHPSLLTVAAREILTQSATLVLSDKLVPSAILNLIPTGVQVRIARKFPGNADQAQRELMELAAEAAERGEIVARLKQGDPMVYGRAGEEILYFRERGHEPVIVPGLSSAITGPALANIPVTQRGVAETFIVCTGVGRNGKEVQMPGYQRERTTIVLMGVARLSQLVQCLTVPETSRRVGDRYPGRTPIAIIERSSMPDQRVVLSTLRDIEEAFASLGVQRPPGMIVVGWAVLALAENGFIDILDDSDDDSDEKRLKMWLGKSTFKVVEGLSEALIAL